jgi:hypothetical protein
VSDSEPLQGTMRVAARLHDLRTWGLTYLGACAATTCALLSGSGLSALAKAMGVIFATAIGFTLCLILLPPWQGEAAPLRRTAAWMVAFGTFVVLIAFAVAVAN